MAACQPPAGRFAEIISKKIQLIIQYQKTIPLKIKLFLFSALVIITLPVGAQTVTGSWFGTGDVILEGTHNNYLVELNLKQDQGEVQGIIGYYFRDQYQSFYIRGRFDKKARQLVILNIPMIYFRSNSRNSAECPMDLEARLITSLAQSTLRGTFHSQEKYKYTCPEIGFSYILGDDKILDPPDLKERRSSLTKIWKPQNEDLVVDVNEAARTAKSGSNEPPSKAEKGLAAKSISPSKQEVIPAAKNLPDSNTRKQQADTKPVTASSPNSNASTTTSQAATTLGQPPPAKDSIQGVMISSVTAAAKPDSAQVRADQKTSKPQPPSGVPFEKRKDITIKEIEIESDSVRISLYDNGDIDGDIISLYFNKIPLVFNQELNDRGLNLYVTLDSTKEVNEVTMFAENLGRIPPNTALMVITDGLNRYEVFMSSSLTQNSTVKLRRKKEVLH